ncbi:hypothetical protein [Eisenbergiella tayi]|uniref:hypothetical protein n=1 Tax=Eisenbergiella tayi TaxID=1432052 RepID=UPI00242ADA1E|nr:hypothetical protein [Eisenbergiella tayi]
MFRKNSGLCRKKESEGLLALFVVVGFPEPCASAIVFVRLPSPVPSCGRRFCKVPVRVRFRSDKHAAVLRLQRTQPKDRRVYTALTGILAEPPPAGGNGGGQPDGNDGRRTGLREQVGCVGRESRAWEADREERGRSERAAC